MLNNNQMDMDRESINMNRQQIAMNAGYADDAMYASRAENGDLTKWQQDIQKQIDDLKMQFRGYKLNTEGDWYLPDEPVKIMNEKGIAALDVLFRPLISVNNIMSNYEQEWILRVLKRNVLKVIFHFGKNYKYYEVRKANLDLIISSFKSIAEPTFFRALNNGERNFLNTQNRRIQTINENPQQQGQKTFMGFPI